MAEKKITKREVFEAVKDYFENGDIAVIGDADAEVDVDAVVEVMTKAIEQLDKKNEAAKKRAAEKKTQGDEVRAAVKAVITDELQTIDQIFEQVEVEGVELTRAKVTARLTQLVKLGEIAKEKVKAGDRTVMGYRLATEADAVDAEDAE